MEDKDKINGIAYDGVSQYTDTGFNPSQNDIGMNNKDKIILVSGQSVRLVMSPLFLGQSNELPCTGTIDYFKSTYYIPEGTDEQKREYNKRLKELAKEGGTIPLTLIGPFITTI
jgi:hypothetical protein